MPPAQDRTLVTGFLAFGDVPVNPSALLAQRSERRFQLVEVAYAAVDQWIDALDVAGFDRLLLMGVAGRSSRLRTENIARNIIGARLDVRGLATPGPIDPLGPEQLRGTLWQAPVFASESPTRRPSHDAGDFLCNYLYYRALRRLQDAGKSVGFLHVPLIEQMPLDSQLAELHSILRHVERPT